MYARVARFEGGEAGAIRRTAEQIKAQAASGPPEGVPTTGFLLLMDPDGGRMVGVSLFETEDDLRQGDKVLNEMSPPEEGTGRRASVEVYEVALDVRMPG
jgi:hypothetical protein